MTAPVQRTTVEGVLANHEKRVGILEAVPPSTGLLIRGPYNITHADDLGAGVALFAVAVGDVLYDAFSVVRTAFRGTSAQNAVRIYVGSTLWQNTAYPASGDISVTTVNIGFVDDFTGSLSLGGLGSNSQQYLQGIASSAYYSRTAAVVLTAGNVIVKSIVAWNPTVGDADIYVLAGTPVA